MSLKNFFIILLLFIPMLSVSQIFQKEICNHTEVQRPLEKVYQHPCNQNNINDTINKETILYNIPIKFWIYRKSDGKGGLTIEDMKEHIRNLNYYYSINTTGIRFYLRPDYEFIDNDRLFKLNYISQAPFQTFRHKSKGCINVYVADKLKINKKFSIDRNYSGTYNSFSRGVLLAKGVSSSTLSHEIGHFLGLKHTHRFWKFKLFQEPVSRTKKAFITNKKMCEKRGDKLCDTPAEPNLTKYTDKKCHYTGWNVKDKHGEVYKPSTNNIMSYTYNRECRSVFTKGQIAVMHKKLSNTKSRKIWNTNTTDNQKFNFDFFEPDDAKTVATEIFFNTPQVHTFHKTFAGNRKPYFNDKTDWLFFDLKTSTKQNITISVSKSEYLFSDIKITVTNNSKKIAELDISPESVPKTIKLSNIKKGKYYIKIHQTSDTVRFAGYKVKVGK